MAEREIRFAIKDPSSNTPADSAWGSIVQKLAINDEESMQSVVENMNTLLVFAGLLSAALTSFVIDSYKALTSDPNDQVISILKDISLQLSGRNATAQSEQAFQPSESAIRINIFWFLALSLSLFAAFLALLAKEWISSYMSYVVIDPKADAVHIRQWRAKEFWQVSPVLYAIPILLQLSLFLFLIGIVDFLWHLQRNVALFVIPFIGLMLLIALIFQWQPVFSLRSPFRTLITLLFRQSMYQTWIYAQRLFRLSKPAQYTTQPQTIFSAGWNPTDLAHLRKVAFASNKYAALSEVLILSFETASDDKDFDAVERSLQDLPFVDRQQNPLSCALRIVASQINLEDIENEPHDWDSRSLRYHISSPTKLERRFSLLLSALFTTLKANADMAWYSKGGSRECFEVQGPRVIEHLILVGILLDWELPDNVLGSFLNTMWAILMNQYTHHEPAMEAAKALCCFVVKMPASNAQNLTTFTSLGDRNRLYRLMELIARPRSQRDDWDGTYEVFTLLLSLVKQSYASPESSRRPTNALLTHFRLCCQAIKYRLLHPHRKGHILPQVTSQVSFTSSSSIVENTHSEEPEPPTTHDRFRLPLSTLKACWLRILTVLSEKEILKDEALILLDLLEDHRSSYDLDLANHKFWSTQPVMHGEDWPDEDGAIIPRKAPDEVSTASVPLPDKLSFLEWSFVDIEDSAEMNELYTLLAENYVEDEDGDLIFNYTKELLSWYLKPPGYQKNWWLGVRIKTTSKLVAFVSGIPVKVRLRANCFDACEVNFLCVHVDYRSKGLTPAIILELARQVQLKGISQAIYTAGALLPTPVAVCRYYHRPLDLAKLVAIGFTYSRNVERRTRELTLSLTTSIPGFREATDRDCHDIARLYQNYMQRFDMGIVMTEEDVRHNFLGGLATENSPPPRDGQFMWTYVVEDPNTHKITDFVSFFSVPTRVLKNKQYSHLEVAYLYHYGTDVIQNEFCDQDGSLKARLVALVGEALIVAKNAGFDVFNALTKEDNFSFLEELKFGPGDASLYYYVFNWRTSPLTGLKPFGSQQPGRGIGVTML